MLPDIGLLFQLAGIGILVSIIHTVLTQAGKEEFAWVVTLGGVSIVLLVVVRLIADLFEAVQALFQL